MNLNDLSFTKEWTLFLDRDGVISRRIPDDYVRKWEDFRFLDGVPASLAVFSRIFGRIIIVSNQQGVGKGLMNQAELDMIDSRMKEAIRQHGGRIDASYYCTRLAPENHPDRKPGTGMGLKAKAEFPEIDFSRSVMVGDSSTDMEFGKRLGMITVLITKTTCHDPLADLCFDSLQTLAKTLLNNQ